jgi:hypothetical protein
VQVFGTRNQTLRLADYAACMPIAEGMGCMKTIASEVPVMPAFMIRKI